MGPVRQGSSEDLPRPTYNGEDTRPTSRKELLGFWQVFGTACILRHFR